LTIAAAIESKKAVDRFLALGRYLLALPMLIYPVLHFVYPRFVAAIVPPWIPWHLFWTYFTALTIFAAGLAILFERCAWLASILLGTEILLFCLLIHVFLLFHKAADPWAGAAMFGDLSNRLMNAPKDFGLSGACFVFAGMHSRAWRTNGKDQVMTLGRLILGFSIIAFGVLHFAFPVFAPGIPPMFRDISFPIPGHLFWVYLTAVACLAGGASILINRRARLAATLLGIMILAFDLLTWLPRFFSHPADLTGNWLKDLGIAGGVLILAAALPKEAS